MAYQYQHLEVDDIEIIVSDANFLQALSPRVNDKSASILDHEDSYEEGAACLIIETEEGLIFFKVEPFLSSGVAVDTLVELNGHQVIMETPIEVMLKRVTYRMIYGRRQLPIQGFENEDWFDLACVIQKDGALLCQERAIFGLKARYLDRNMMRSSDECYQYSSERRIKAVPDEFKPLLKSAPSVIREFLKKNFLEEIIGKEMVAHIRSGKFD